MFPDAESMIAGSKINSPVSDVGDKSDIWRV